MKVMNLSSATQISKSRELDVLLGSSLIQRRVLYSCLAVLNPVVPDLASKSHDEVKKWLRTAEEAEDLREYTIKIDEFCKIWGMTKLKDPKGKINDAVGIDDATGVPKIMDMRFKHIAKEIKKGKREATEVVRFINVISSLDLDYDNNEITVRFTDDIMPYLINLASYTAIPFKATIGFKCNYSFAMLEYLLRRYTRGGNYPNHELTLEALHMVLGTDVVKSYKQWSNFKSRVLEPIAEDFNNIIGGGYKLSFEPILVKKSGRGRSTVGSVEIRFDNTGFKRFVAASKARKDGLKHVEENESISVVGIAEQIRKNRELKKKSTKKSDIDWDNDIPF